MKLCFLFLCRGQPYPRNMNVWSHFFKGHEDQYSIVIHPKETWKVTHPLFHKKICSNLCRTEWGDWSLVEATLNLLRDGLKDPDNKYFILCSEACIPIQTFDFIYNTLRISDSTIFFCDNFYGYDYDENIMSKYLEKNRYAKQSQWMILKREDAEELIKEEELKLPFSKVFIPDEHFFINTMIIRNRKWKDGKVTYVNWKLNKGSAPKTFIHISQFDLQELENARKKGWLFARKFHFMSDIDKYAIKWVQ